ncbi:MAG: hypothetical protein QOE15_2396 [Acidimicrobiaceae bacterium]|nr:hypothetical protein [Acidimicrobiaceae bacterium]
MFVSVLVGLLAWSGVSMVVAAVLGVAIRKAGAAGAPHADRANVDGTGRGDRIPVVRPLRLVVPKRPQGEAGHDQAEGVG